MSYPKPPCLLHLSLTRRRAPAPACSSGALDCALLCVPAKVRVFRGSSGSRVADHSLARQWRRIVGYARPAKCACLNKLRTRQFRAIGSSRWRDQSPRGRRIWNAAALQIVHRSLKHVVLLLRGPNPFGPLLQHDGIIDRHPGCLPTATKACSS